MWLFKDNSDAVTTVRNGTAHASNLTTGFLLLVCFFMLCCGVTHRVQEQAHCSLQRAGDSLPLVGKSGQTW